ncbi:MAG TPA: M13 family metallopeptidase [Terriglobales bacterium]|nr:M13 family metallopeptidase [Terriglobales bacterium]
MRIYRFLLALPVLFLLTLALQAQTASGNQTSPGIDLDNIDKAADPCTDFFQYACGSWLKKTEIPPDKSRWGGFDELHERNITILKGILEKVSAESAERSADQQKIGDYYESCMDEKSVNSEGLEPLKPELASIAAASDKEALMKVAAHDFMIGPNPFFSFYANSDLHNASQVIAYIDQGGLTLPDRDYYIKDDDKMVKMRKNFVDYMTEVFTLTGQTAEQAAASAQTVLRIETELAKAAMDRTLRRDPKTQDHKMSREEALKLAPNFYLNAYFEETGAPHFNELNVANPDFFKQVNTVLENEPLQDLKTYVTWQLLNSAAPWLSQPFVDAEFKMHQKLTGQKEIQARWKRCTNLVDSGIGEALGKEYVNLTFGADGKARMLKMVNELEAALAEDIQTLPWMTDATKKQAEIKLKAITNKIGYPDKWRDYSNLTIRRDNLLADYFAADEFESRRQLAKIDKPLDRNEWQMTPPTVNAYYDPSYNEIVFPAGILQPPFFDKNADEAVNFGAIGMVIGHELTHGFDDQGRQFDPQGNLHDWWTEQDAKEFEKRADCEVNEYGSFVAVDDLKLNGKLTLGENTADNGGERIALMALKNVIAKKPNDPAARTIDGYTPEQRFFLGTGNEWCEKRRPEYSRMMVTVDPHSPGKFRVNGVMQNMPEFEKAWGCKAGQPMVSENACRVW